MKTCKVILFFFVCVFNLANAQTTENADFENQKNRFYRLDAEQGVVQRAVDTYLKPDVNVLAKIEEFERFCQNPNFLTYLEQKGVKKPQEIKIYLKFTEMFGLGLLLKNSQIAALNKLLELDDAVIASKKLHLMHQEKTILDKKDAIALKNVNDNLQKLLEIERELLDSFVEVKILYHSASQQLSAFLNASSFRNTKKGVVWEIKRLNGKTKKIKTNGFEKEWKLFNGGVRTLILKKKKKKEKTRKKKFYQNATITY